MEFNYHRPARLQDAVELLRDCESPKLLAGGMTLLPVIKNRLAEPSDLVDLGGLPGLSGVSLQDDRLILGAMTCHRDVEHSAMVRDNIPALASLAGNIGDPQVRNRGTVGGSIANCDPAADYPSALLALDAMVVTDRRNIAADDFFVDMFETLLEPDEIVTSIEFPICSRATYVKYRHPASRFALVGVFLAERAGQVRLAITGAAPSVFRYAEMEEALSTTFHPDAIKSIRMAHEGLNQDIFASAEYRAHLIDVIARRAVQSLL